MHLIYLVLAIAAAVLAVFALLETRLGVPPRANLTAAVALLLSLIFILQLAHAHL